jgi:hypothetical protein
VSKNLRKFSLTEWQIIDPTTKQRNVLFRPAKTAGFGPWHRDIAMFYVNYLIVGEREKQANQGTTSLPYQGQTSSIRKKSLSHLPSRIMNNL